MPAGRGSQLVRDLGAIFGPGGVRAGDRALLGEFVDRRDEAAFEALVIRHGPMVRGVCGRFLADPHDVDDAFQATFLVLFIKGGRLRDADRLGPWLYGVASRVAAKARVQAARRRGRHEEGGMADAPAPPEPVRDFGLGPVLDAEIARLPGKLRSAVVHCLVEGISPDRAAQVLGCPVGTVKSRLARGRAALRARLEARGVAPAAPFAALASPAPVPVALTRATAVAVAGSRLAPSVVALAQGVAPAMIAKTTALAALLVGGTLLAGGGLVATWTQSPAVAQQPGAASATGAKAQLEPARLTNRHMRQIALAFHGYHSSFEYPKKPHFPPRAFLGVGGQPLLSWRVAILPYLNDDASNTLYNEFHLDEAWDSPHNQALIARMPEVYETPDSPAPPGHTRLREFDGKATMFDLPQGVGLDQVPDGTSNTILIVQARNPVAWTRPEGLPFAYGLGGAAQMLDQSDPTRVRVGMVDGAVLDLVPPSDRLLSNMITRNGGEVMAQPMLYGSEVARERLAGDTPLLAPTPAATPPAGGGGMAAAMGPERAAGPAETVEQRLGRVEAKLDRLLEILDRRPGEAEKPRD